MGAWEAGLTGQLRGPGIDAGAARTLAGDLRGLASMVTGGPGAGAGAGGWQGEAALSYATWVARLVDVIETTVSVAVAAAGELRDVADAGDAALSEIGRLQGEVALAAADPATLGRAADRAAAVVQRQDGVERRAAARLTDLARQVSGAPVGACRVEPVAGRNWTAQQWRDAGRGVGDAAWDIGPGAVSALLRWTTVPGWLDAYDGLDRWENEAKASLDEWGGGRTDTATNRAAYATAAVLTALIPVPSGKTTVVARGTGAAAGFMPAPAEAAWVGRGGEWLSEADLRAVDEFHAAAVVAEPRITAIMDDVMVGLPSVAAAGRQHVLKSPDSLRRKIAAGMQGSRSGVSVGEALDLTNDTVRYTFIAADDVFIDHVNTLTARLLGAGLSPTVFRSSWEGPRYRGINTTWVDDHGLLVEVQFHTRTSLWAKELTHGWYEEIRLLNALPRDVVRLNRLQAEVFQSVPMPAGLSRLVDPTRRLT